jgi:hypothetical protein
LDGNFDFSILYLMKQSEFNWILKHRCFIFCIGKAFQLRLALLCRLDLIIIVSIVFFGLNCGSFFFFFFLLLLPKITNYIGKLEREYEMILKRTLQSICILTLNPNTHNINYSSGWWVGAWVKHFIYGRSLVIMF